MPRDLLLIVSLNGKRNGMHPAKRVKEDPLTRDTVRTTVPIVAAVDDDSEDDDILVRSYEKTTRFVTALAVVIP